MAVDVSTAAVIMGVPSAVTGLCFWVIQRGIARRDAARDAREQAREKNEVLLIQSVGAAVALAEATAIAIRDGKHNGELATALTYAQKVQHEQKDFLTEQGVKALC